MQSGDAIKTGIPRCKDGCCPRLEPYPTWLTVIAAVGMLFMWAVILAWIAAMFWLIWTASVLWFGVSTIPIALTIWQIARRILAGRGASDGGTKTPPARFSD